jgi:hypothetical protein
MTPVNPHWAIVVDEVVRHPELLSDGVAHARSRALVVVDLPAAVYRVGGGDPEVRHVADYEIADGHVADCCEPAR